MVEWVVTPTHTCLFLTADRYYVHFGVGSPGKLFEEWRRWSVNAAVWGNVCWQPRVWRQLHYSKYTHNISIICYTFKCFTFEHRIHEVKCNKSEMWSLSCLLGICPCSVQVTLCPVSRVRGAQMECRHITKQTWIFLRLLCFSCGVRLFSHDWPFCLFPRVEPHVS